IGIKRGSQDLHAGVPFTVSVTNPYPEVLSGQATWLLDASAFSVEPPSAALRIPAGATHQYGFTLKALHEGTTLQSLPRLQFNVVSSGRRYLFHREVRFLQEFSTPYRKNGPVLDGELGDWAGIPSLNLGGGSSAEVELRTCYDDQSLYLALQL